MIEVVNVTHHYGVKPVLREVSFNVSAGELVALMGPNGMGKSTLVGVIAGVLWPLKGYVAIDGVRRRCSEEGELAIRKKVVYLPADPWAPVLRTGRQWMLAVGRVYGVDDDRLLAHVERLLDVFNLTDQADSYISGYSTGQKKKIALCAALVSDAPVMLLDEPFAGGLDPSGILALKQILLRHKQKKNRTILIATPVPELVEELADRVAVVSEGRISAYGTVDELREKSGTSAGLDLAYQKLASPRILEKLERYFQEEGQ